MKYAFFIRTTLTSGLILTIFIIALFLTGCSGGTGGENQAGVESGSYRLSVAWPDSAAARYIPSNAKRIQVDITGTGIAATISSSITYPETELTIENIPSGHKIATIKALNESSILLSQRKESFTIQNGNTTDSKNLPLGVAVKMSGTNKVFEPTVITVKLDSDLPFQNWTENSVTITGVGSSFTVDGATLDLNGIWTFDDVSMTITESATANIQGGSGTCGITMTTGGAWSAQTSGTSENLQSVCFFDINTGWAAGENGAILKTTDGGINWNIKTTGVTHSLRGIQFMDANTGWVVSPSSYIYKTTDGGENWVSCNDGTSNPHNDIHFIDLNTGWVVGGTNPGTVRKSTNGGANWSSSGTASASLYGVHFVDSQTGWVVGGSGTIRKTTDGGSSWSTQTSGSSRELRDVHFFDSQTGWVAGSSGTILYTSDGGANWNPQTSGTSENLRDVHFINASTGWAAGYNGTILYTGNGGSTWSPMTSGTSSDIEGIYFFNSSTGWAVGDGGLILKFQ